MWPFNRKETAKPARTMGRHKRYYQAASFDRLTAGWTTEAKSPDKIVIETLNPLRGRSREQYANNDYMQRFISLARSNIIGPKGVSFQATARNPAGDLDAMANTAVETAFTKWASRGNCEESGGLSFVDVQNLFIASVLVDGEFLAREHYPTDGSYYLELLDAEQLDVQHNRTDLPGGNIIKFGIEFGPQSGRPVAYYLRVIDSEYSWNGRKYTRVPAADIIHLFIPDRIGQKRGVPAASTALMRMNMLSGYEDAAITAARVGASKMGFFTSPSGAAYTGDDEAADGSIISDVEPGVFEQLPDGVEFTAFNPDYPHQQFGDFVKSCLRGVASGLGVSYNSLSNDLEGVNYSSIRAGVLEDREAWKALQEWAIEALHRRVYNHWLPHALLQGEILSPAYNPLPMGILEKLRAHTWQPRRWSWVDPLKDTQANVLAINSGLKSRAEVIREQGRDPVEVWAELEKEQEALAGILQTDEQPEVVQNDEED